MNPLDWHALIWEKKVKLEFLPSWKGNTKGILGKRKSGFKPPPFRNQPINFQQGKQARSGIKLAVAAGKRPKGPLQCWGCGGNRMLKDYPHWRENPWELHNLEE